MTTLLSISALLITVMLMQMGTGALGPLDTLSGIELGFSNIQIGIIGAAHFTGFIIGCFGAPALVRRLAMHGPTLLPYPCRLQQCFYILFFQRFGLGACSECLLGLPSRYL